MGSAYLFRECGSCMVGVSVFGSFFFLACDYHMYEYVYAIVYLEAIEHFLLKPWKGIYNSS